MSSHHQEPNELRVAYVTAYDPTDRANYPGLGYAMMEALRSSGLAVTPIGPLKMKFSSIGKFKGAMYRRVLRRGYHLERECITARGLAQQIHRRLNQGRYDLVFSPSSIPISQLNYRLPIVIWTDATWACYIAHYGLETVLCEETIRAGHRTEQNAYRRCSTIIFSSEWAASSAVSDYGVSAEKIKVVPFGANFILVPSRDEALQSAAARPMDSCQLITIGVDWYRKGIPRAIELASTLNDLGIRTELTVVGTTAPPGVSLPDFVQLTGFIDKQTSAGEQRISQLLKRSHFHVLLSSADATPHVFSEANAHAVPNIASDVGGISTVVVNNHGGQRFPLATPIGSVAKYVQSHILNRDLYIRLCINARRQYDERLNWNAAGTLVKRYLEAIVA